MPSYNFNINWVKFAIDQMEVAIRKLPLVQYIVALLRGIAALHRDFIYFRAVTLYEAEINGQVIKLERILNDMFDEEARRIYITDGDVYVAPVFYEEYKNNPVVFPEEGDSAVPIFYSIEAADDVVSFNFYVHIPEEVYVENLRIKAIVNRYKVMGRTYQLVIIE